MRRVAPSSDSAKSGEGFLRLRECHRDDLDTETAQREAPLALCRFAATADRNDPCFNE